MTDVAPTLAGLEPPAPPKAARAARTTRKTTTKVRHITGAGARKSGDHIALFAIEVAGTIAIALAAFTVSVTSLLAVAEWQRTPDVLHFLTPVMVDLPVVVFTTMTITFKYREQLAPKWFARILAFVLTTFSSIANFLHTAEVGGLGTYEAWVGACFNAAAPWIVLCCTELLGHLITRPKGERGLVARQKAEIKQLRRQVSKLTAATKGIEA